MRVTVLGPEIDELKLDVQGDDVVYDRVLSALGTSAERGFTVVFGESEIAEEETFADHRIEDGARSSRTPP